MLCDSLSGTLSMLMSSKAARVQKTGSGQLVFVRMRVDDGFEYESVLPCRSDSPTRRSTHGKAEISGWAGPRGARLACDSGDCSLGGAQGVISSVIKVDVESTESCKIACCPALSAVKAPGVSASHASPKTQCQAFCVPAHPCNVGKALHLSQTHQE